MKSVPIFSTHRKLHRTRFNVVSLTSTRLRSSLIVNMTGFHLHCNSFIIKVTLLRHAMVNSWGSTFVFSGHCIAQVAFCEKRGDTSDTAFCGNCFPREESIDIRESQRL